MIQVPHHYIKLKNVATGEIDGFITCFGAGTIPTSEDTILLPDSVPEELISHDTPATHFYSNGELVAKPAKVSNHHVFNYATKQWEASFDIAYRLACSLRSQLLEDTDWRAIKAAETGTPMLAAWQAYRQALRDITQQSGFPLAIDWPISP